MAKKKTPSDGPITIKKYANRRLYNTATSSYVTLDHLCEMVKSGQDFQVFDAKSGDDITKSVLTQIIFEEEAKGENLLPTSFLRQLIQFYGDTMQSLVPSYLEMSMDNLSRNRADLMDQFAGAMGANPALKGFENQVRQNMAMFQKTMSMFSPFFPVQQDDSNTSAQESDAAASSPEEALNSDEMDELKDQISKMQQQLDSLSKKT